MTHTPQPHREPVIAVLGWIRKTTGQPIELQAPILMTWLGHQYAGWDEHNNRAWHILPNDITIWLPVDHQHALHTAAAAGAPE